MNHGVSGILETGDLRMLRNTRWARRSWRRIAAMLAIVALQFWSGQLSSAAEPDGGSAAVKGGQALGVRDVPAVDVAEFDRLLRTYVTDDGWVDYTGLARERAALDRFLEQLAGVSPADYRNTSDRLAFWINAYNAFTLADALDTVYGNHEGVRQVNGFFDKRKHKVAREQLTLDEIEKRGRDLQDPRHRVRFDELSEASKVCLRGRETGRPVVTSRERVPRGSEPGTSLRCEEQ
jgi:hypothetical protein